MDFSWLGKQDAGRRGRMWTREGEGEYQLLLECRSNMRQRGKGGRGRCVCVFARVSGFYAPFRAAPCQGCVGVLCWQPYSHCGLKLLGSLEASLKQSRTAFQTNVSTLGELGRWSKT